MWHSQWSWREGSLIAGSLFLVGLALQLTIGPVPTPAFAFPFNVGWPAVLVVAIFVYSWLRSRNPRRYTFFSGPVATLTAIGALLLVLLLMGFTKQIPVEMSHALPHPLHAIGVSTMLSTWYFLLLYVYLLFVLGCVTLRRLFSITLTLRDFAFLMNHLGLFVALLFGLMAAADVKRYRMQVDSEGEFPEWRAHNQDTREYEELPLAIELQRFEIDEYPPKLMMIRNSDGKMLPLHRPQHLVLDRVPQRATLNGYTIEVESYLPYSAAVVTPDSIVFKDFRSVGAVHSAKIHVKGSRQESTTGWVSADSHLFPYRSLPLNDSLSIVMTQPEPKQFRSHVVFYAQNGDSDSAVIRVNEPLRYGNWYIYQLSYDKEKGRWSTLSEFELVYDRWLWGVYVGIAMLFLGAICLFFGPLPSSPSPSRQP